MEVRGHYVTWAPLDRWQSRFIGRPVELRRAVWSHMEEKLPAVGKRVGEWDAINHIVGWGETFASVSGGNQIYADVIKKSRELAPHAEMWVNEGQVLSGVRTDNYEQVIRFLTEQDAAPDGIGFMGHFSRRHLPSPDLLLERFDRFARLVPNLQLTELDVDVGDDEALQADYLRDVMTAAFSHEAFQGIIMWGFWEGRHWKPNAALYRRDWSIKPAGQMWLDLVKRDWWTDETGKTDARGRYRTRGFLGDYTVTVEHEGVDLERSLSLSSDDTELVVTIVN
jgi:GH35 family endo-1,4-beta-xylanase